MKEFKVRKSKQNTVKDDIILDNPEDSLAPCQIKSQEEYCCLVERKVSLVSRTFLGKTKEVLLKIQVKFKISNLRCYTECLSTLTGTLKPLNESGDLSLWGLLKRIRSNILFVLQRRLLWSLLDFRPTLIYFFTRSKSVLWWEPLWFLKSMVLFPPM